MNNKGFAISVILYSMVILIVSIFTIYLGMVEHRYNVSTKLVDTIEKTIDQKDLSNKATVLYSKMGCAFKIPIDINIKVSYKEDVEFKVVIYKNNDVLPLKSTNFSTNDASIVVGTANETAVYKVVTYVYEKGTTNKVPIDSLKLTEDGGYYEIYLRDLDNPSCYFEEPDKSTIMVSSNFRTYGTSINLVCTDLVGFDLSGLSKNSFSTNAFFQVMSAAPKGEYIKSFPSKLKELENIDYYSYNKITITLWLKGVSVGTGNVRLNIGSIKDASGNSNNAANSSNITVTKF